MEILNIIPKATTTRDIYYNFLIIGGDPNLLPKPTNKRDEFLYALCWARGGGSLGVSVTKKYIKAILNSDSAQKNYVGVIYDLGETKKVTNAKVTFRFTLRNTGTDKPSSIGTRLFANNDPGRDVIAGYSLEHNDRVTNVEYDKEYTIETEYSATSGVNNLNTCRYLKPFLVLNKTTQTNEATHGIDIHEVTIEVEGEKYDVTETVKDFTPKAASKVEIVEEKTSSSSIQNQSITYVKALLNSDAGAVNYFSTFYDLGETKKITEAKVKFRFTLRNTGNDKPGSIEAKLFANNEADRNNITGYVVNVASLVSSPEYDKEYTVEANYVATDSNSNNLNTCRYIKPFVVLNKATQGKDKTHGIDIHEVTIEIEGEKYDITKTVQDFAPQGASKVEIVEESISKPQTIQTTSAKTTATLPFAGKVLDFIGDSNVFGLDPNNGGNLRKKVAKPYVEQLKELCGFAEVNNYGISSSTLATKSSDPAWNNARNPVCIRYADMKPADVIGFAIGINDFWLGVSLGTFNPDDTNTDTFYGALNVFLKGLITKFPKAAIFGFTMIDYKDKTRGYGANSAGYTLEQLREAIRTGCSYYNIPVLEGPEMGFSTKVEAQRNLLMPDDLHYTQEAHNIIARKSSKFINYKL